MRDHWLNRWWVHALFGVLWLVLSVYCWCRIRDWEANPLKPNPFTTGGFFLEVVPNTFYWIGGKWLVFATFLIFSAIAFNAAYMIRRGYVVLPYQNQESVAHQRLILNPVIPEQLIDTTILHVLGRVPLDPLPVQVKALKHILPAIDYLEFQDFEGEATSVLERLDSMLCVATLNEEVLWAWVYTNEHRSQSFSTELWWEALNMNLQYARYAVDAAYLFNIRGDFFALPRLELLLRDFKAWTVASERIVDAPEPMRAWWNEFVAPLRPAWATNVLVGHAFSP
jgi:hypothetical protein